MAFKLITSAAAVESAEGAMRRLTIAEAAQALGVSYDTVRRRVKRGQLPALRRNDGAWLVEIRPEMVKQTPEGASHYATQAYITSLCSQIEALYRQINELTGERAGLTALLRQMVEARERELAAWQAREALWEQRLAASESAVRERDELLDRQAQLMAELDDARRAADAAHAELATARDALGHGRDELATAQAQLIEAQAAAERALAEQERLRVAFNADRTAWVKDRRQLEAKTEQYKKEAERGWLSRLFRGKAAF